MAVGRPLWRALVWAYAILFVFFVVTTGGKIYYLAGTYVYLLRPAPWPSTAGWPPARASSRAAAGHGGKLRGAVPLVLPVLPPGDMGWT